MTALHLGNALLTLGLNDLIVVVVVVVVVVVAHGYPLNWDFFICCWSQARPLFLVEVCEAASLVQTLLGRHVCCCSTVNHDFCFDVVVNCIHKCCCPALV